MTQGYPSVLWSLPDMLFENDCACAISPGYIQATDSPTSGRWWCSPSLHSMPLPNDQTLIVNLDRPGPISVLNQAALRILTAFDVTNHPQSVGRFSHDHFPDELVGVACQLASLGILQPDEGALPVVLPPRTLTAWLHITNSCNLSCSYCYVSKSTEDMNEDTGLVAINALFRSARHHSYRSIKLKYAGGEPTRNFGLVRTLHSHAGKMASQRGISLQEVILSNGVALTESMLDFIASDNMRLMISLDGMGAAHDSQRPFTNGAPSSRLVLDTVDRAIAQGVKPFISITVSPTSAEFLAETVSFALDRDLLFNLNLVRTGLPETAGWEAAFIADLRAALAVIEARLPQRRLIDGLIDSSSFAGTRDFPCGAGHDYLVITHQGKIVRCHMTLTETVSDIWEADPLAAVRSPSRDFRVLPASGKAECCKCEWRSVCGGGCPLLALRTTGRGDVSSPYCNVYRAIFPELLRLEGLRILKWQRAN
jgi:uncharacterized protein